MIPALPEEHLLCLRSFEELLVEYCSPTLSGCKCASLFRVSIRSERCVRACLAYGKHLLGKKGIAFRSLGIQKSHALILVYRPSALAAELAKPEVADFLEAYGYQRGESERNLDRLSERIGSRGIFPHEIGIFLGYPLEDVKGFIENGGANCLLSGFWKVYARAEEKSRLFLAMNEEKENLKRCYVSGSPLEKLAV